MSTPTIGALLRPASDGEDAHDHIIPQTAARLRVTAVYVLEEVAYVDVVVSVCGGDWRRGRAVAHCRADRFVRVAAAVNPLASSEDPAGGS